MELSIKKILFIFFLILIGCEDDNEESPLVGVWEMNEMSGGLFLRLNKTQEVYLGTKEGKIEAKTYIDEKINDTFSLTEFNVNKNQDGTFVVVRNTYNENLQYSTSYYIDDYAGSLDQYDESRFTISSSDGYYNYTGKEFDYIASDKSVKVSSDTVYRELYINNKIIIDSTRYTILNGEIKKVASTINANENYFMNDQMFFPDKIIFTLEEDGKGTIRETIGNETMESMIEWVATDSTFQWNYCYEDGPFGKPDCQGGGPIFKYTMNGNSLVLFLYQDQCALMPDGFCDEMMNLQYGIEIGTLDAFWSEINITFSKTENKVFKKMRTKNNLLNKNGKQFSLIQNLKK